MTASVRAMTACLQAFQTIDFYGASGIPGASLFLSP